MQRRAAAVYFILFLLIGAGMFGFLQVGAEKPHVELDGPTLSQGDTLTVDGRTYTVANISKSGSGGGGGHGGGGDATLSGKLTWTNVSARMTATLGNNTTTTYQDDTYRVHIANRSNVSSFTLVEEQNVTAILASDPDVEDALYTQNGVKYVNFTDGSGLQRLSKYLPEPERVSFAVGDTMQYPAESGTVTATVDAVTTSAVTLAWRADTPGTPKELAEGSNVTLNGQTYFVHFPSEDTVQVLPTSEYYDDYQEELATIDAWNDRRNGIWGVIILCVLAAIVLLSTAYMPVK